MNVTVVPIGSVLPCVYEWYYKSHLSDRLRVEGVLESSINELGDAWGWSPDNPVSLDHSHLAMGAHL